MSEKEILLGRLDERVKDVEKKTEILERRFFQIMILLVGALVTGLFNAGLLLAKK